MPRAFTNNVAGHRSKYETLAASTPAEKVGRAFVGDTDPVLTGYYELELIRSVTDLNGASVVDIGCGIGRLTRHLLDEKISSYLGTDIVPEIMREASDLARQDPRFRFAIADECKIPSEDRTADIVVAFSVITHLIDEEVFEYLQEARRVLKPGGTAIFSFFDFMNAAHVEMFFRHVSQHRQGHGGMLRFTTQEVLEVLAKRAGFKRIAFQSGQTPLPLSGSSSKLLKVRELSPTFSMGQSICALTA